MRSTFLVYETLRHGYDLLFKHVASWLRSVVAFRDWNNSHAELFYQLLDVSESWLSTYVELEIRFVGGQLLIADSESPASQPTCSSHHTGAEDLRCR